jgi:hypothetical protein
VVEPDLKETGAADERFKRLWTYIGRIAVLISIINEGKQLGGGFLALVAGPHGGHPPRSGR